MKVYHWDKAKAVVDAYLTALETRHPLTLGRSWIEIQMSKSGLVDDWRGFEFGESHAAWYSCLIRTGNIGRVTAAESARQSNPSTTAKTIRKLRNGRMRDTITARYMEQMKTL